MTDAETLLAAVWADPHADAPRLVYADWCDEHGDRMRATYIRVQCELAALAGDDPRRAGLARRAAGLWTAHRKAFRRGLPDRLREHPFARGFVAPMLTRVTYHRLARMMERDELRHAPLWDVGVWPIDPDELAALAARPALLRVGRLKLAAGGPTFPRLLDSPFARNLAALDCGFAFAGADGVARLTDPGRFPHLSVLRLGNPDIGPDAAADLGDSELADRLTDLGLPDTGLKAEAVRALLAAGRFGRLARLDLSYANPGYANPGDEVVAAMVEAPPLPALRELRLFGGGLTAAAADMLADWPGGRTLRCLDMSGNVAVGAAGVRRLVESPRLAGLTRLAVFPSRANEPEVTRLLTDRFGRTERRPHNRFDLRGTSEPAAVTP